MLFWFVLGTAFMVAGLRIRNIDWWYSEEITGALLPAACAAFMTPGWALLQFDEPGFQALGLLLAGCAAWMWLAAILVLVGTAIEALFDLIEDLREDWHEEQ